MKIKNFINENRGYIILNLIVLVFINVYLILLKDRMEEIYYLDIILVMIYTAAFLLKYKEWKERYDSLYKCIEEDIDISIEYIENEFIAEEIMRYIINKKDSMYSEVIDTRDEQLKDMEEYISRWVHEIKLPISALNMIIDRIDDAEISTSIKSETEKINFLVNSVMYGSRATAASEDIFIAEEKLDILVKKAIKNNAFFLIKNNMKIKMNNLDQYVYTDEKWILYVLDQLINNAIKYSKENGEIKFYGEETDKYICLNIEDNGVGIKKEDIERVFNKGFTGSNGRNDTYKSTGMGLYFSKKILDKLGNSIEVNSVRGEYTLFKIKFHKISDYTTITKM